MALSGMTGFARVEGAAGGWTWTVEARSVNGRGLETRFRGPGGFDGLERAARDAAQGRFQRGQLNVTVQAHHVGDGGGVRINVEQLERYLEFCRPYVESGRATLPAMDGLLGLHGVIESNGEAGEAEALAATEAAMIAAIATALDRLRVARLEEGAALTRVLSDLIDTIE
ncbi:MAG TPA: YicC/YloC family endoribonuclease, partial [Caulobacteraceae bacterium]|nr:YicC/YloC family endoribonuclease [Caulobacteraceae bacterium]